jgi:hypothetical protein
LRAGMSGDLGDLAVNTRVHTYDQYARTRLRVHWAPDIPHALSHSERAEHSQKLGPGGPRDREAMPETAGIPAD